MTQPTPIKEPIADPNRFATRAWIRWFQDFIRFVTKKTKVVTRNPYDITVNDTVLFFNTDSTPITANLPAGTDELSYTLKNVGNSGNDVTINPNGSETIEENTIYDGESFQLRWSSSENWRVV